MLLKTTVYVVTNRYEQDRGESETEREREREREEKEKRHKPHDQCFRTKLFDDPKLFRTKAVSLFFHENEFLHCHFLALEHALVNCAGGAPGDQGLLLDVLVVVHFKGIQT